MKRFLASVVGLAVLLAASGAAGGPAASVAVSQTDAEDRALHVNAAQGDADSQVTLGQKYLLRLGVPEDATAAVRWFRLAANQGHAGGQFNLGLMYMSGEGVPQDVTEGRRWYRLAAEQGHAQAQAMQRLEESVRNYNEGLTKARRHAEETENYYTLAAYLEPNRWLMVNLVLGRATDDAPMDDIGVVRLYRLAQGEAAAQFGLGVMYWGGRGVLKDRVLAHMWLNIASANGEGAREVRDGLEGEMPRAEIARATELARVCMASNYQDCDP